MTKMTMTITGLCTERSANLTCGQDTLASLQITVAD